MKSSQSLRVVDYEQLGYQTMMETRSEDRALAICGLKLLALSDELRPDMNLCQTELAEKRHRAGSMCVHLYNRPRPVSDAAMIAMLGVVMVTVVLFAGAVAAATASHAATFALFGLSMPTSILMGVLVTVVAIIAGHQCFDRILRGHPALEGIIAGGSVVLCFWGLFQFAQARALMAGEVLSVPAVQTTSFVDDPTVGNTAAEAPSETRDVSPEQQVHTLLRNALIKVMLALDVVIGLLLGAITAMYRNPDFVAWKHAKVLRQQIARRERHFDDLVALLEMAQKHTAIGILKGKHFENANHLPYLRAIVGAFLLTACAGRATEAQTHIRREEVILIDTSGSIGAKGHVSDLFVEYQAGTKQLLLTEPPDSRVFVRIISTDSFGGVQTLLRGWTPSAQGVFLDNVTRARAQLSATFQAKAAHLSAVAAATDIFGGLWHTRTSLDGNGPATLSVDIHIFSDMVNEIPGFVMPALLPLGAERMLEIAKAKGFLVPLSGCRVYVHGASTTGLSPQMWNTIKTFWTMYFKAAGAELAMYSSEVAVDRR